MTSPQDPFRAPDGSRDQPAPYGPPPGAPASGQPAGAAPVGQGGYGGYGSPPAARKNGFGIAALVLGVIALLTGLVLGGIPFGIAAIVFGVLGRKRAKRGEADNGGMALAGLILGVLGLLGSLAVIAAGASFLSQNSGSFSELTSCLEQAQGDPNAEAECQAEFEDELTN